MFSGNVVQNKTWPVVGDGTVQNPGISFFSGKTTGFSRNAGNVNVSIQGVGIAHVSSNTLYVDGNLTAGSYIANYTPFLPNILVSNIQLANATYVVQDDTAVSTNGGFVVMNGTNFGPGTSVTVGGTQASSVTFVSTSKLNVQVPAKAAGSYTVEATRADGTVATVPLGITYSPFPVWSTPAILANVAKYTAFTYTLSAPSDSNVTYANTTSLPPGTTLTTSGVLSGNIIVDPGNTTVYSFEIDAIDTEYQNIPRIFSLTASDAYPRSISGLVGWYDGSSWTGTQWTDKSGIGNHAVTIRGTVGTSTLNGNVILTGTTTAGIKFPVAIVPSTYTLFHVAKYNGASKLRIFDGVTQNWLSGFLNALSGVAFHNGWITAQTDSHGTSWVLSTDQNNLYRSNYIDRTIAAPGTPSYDQIAINYGANQIGGAGQQQLSDWAVAEVIVYNRTLSLPEIQSVELYLAQRYSLLSIEIMRSTMSVATTTTGTYTLPYNGVNESVYVLNTGSELWMLVGVGRENFNFTDAGNGTLSQITTNRNSNTAYWASSSFVREVMNSTSWTADTNGLMVQRFDGCNDSLRYKMSTASVQFNWSYFNPGNDVTSSPYQGIVTRYATNSWWSASVTYTTSATVYWIDTNSAGSASNDAQRAFTWAWSGHNFVRGFSSGPTVTIGYQYASEAHAIQRVNCWARLK